MTKKVKIIKGQELYDMIDKNVDYDKEDLELLEEMKNSEFVSMEKEDPKGYAKFKKELQKAAKNHLETKKMISLRLARQDINKVKEMAAEEGIPYQTFLSAIIHKIANGKVKLSVKL